MDQEENEPVIPPVRREIVVPVLNQSYGSLANRLREDPHFNRLEIPNIEPIVFDYTDLKYEEDIGFSQYPVKKYVHRGIRRPLAVKIINIPQSRFKDPRDQVRVTKLLREITIHSNLTSDHVVKFYGFCIHDGAAHICMEYMDMGTLSDLYPRIHIQHRGFPKELLGWIAVSVVNAIRDLLVFSVVHRDIKPDNILINNDGEIKLCDFGESRVLEAEVATSFVGTVQYLPPERLLSENFEYDQRSDVWSLGITLMELILNRLPYITNENERQRLEERGALLFFQDQILNIQPNPEVILDQINGVPTIYDETMFQFLRRCLCNLERRARFSTLQEELFYLNHAEINRNEIRILIIID